VKNLWMSTVTASVTEGAKSSSTLYSDEFLSCNGTEKLGCSQEQIEHNAKIYVRGDTHTNNTEGLWSPAKRAIDGVYHKADKEYLQSYVR